MALKFVKNKNVSISKSFYSRIKTGIKNLDALFDTGMLPGMVLTVAGKHGTGKTQFLLQTINELAKKKYRVGYASCEESLEQLAFTSNRIGVDVPISTFESPDEIFSAMESLDVLVMDSFSMMHMESGKGVRKNERDLVDRLYAKAKETNCCLFIILHLTKNGDLKGTSYIPHKVDANLYLERVEDTEMKNARRIFFTKNRFGCPSEIFVTLTATGYDFNNPVEYLIGEKDEEIVEEVLAMPKISGKKSTQPTFAGEIPIGDPTIPNIFHKIKSGYDTCVRIAEILNGWFGGRQENRKKSC